MSDSNAVDRIVFNGELWFTTGDQAVEGASVSREAPDRRSFQMGGRESGWVADLLSISNDMMAVIECAEARDEVEEGGVAYRALFQAATVSYARAFKSGKSFAVKVGRRRAEPLLDVLSAGQIEVHEELIRMRDKHVAHRVDSDEQVYVLANFSHSGGFEGVGAFSTRMGASSELFQGLAEIAQSLWERATELAGDEMRDLEVALVSQMDSEKGVPVKDGVLDVPEVFPGSSDVQESGGDE